MKTRGTAVMRGVIVLGLTCICSPSAAQPADIIEPGIQVGPLAVSPSIFLSNLGLNSNVFNDPVDPKEDMTASIAPAVDVRFRVGKARVVAGTRFSYLHFQKYQSQRTVQTSNSARLELALDRLRPFVEASYRRSRERPNLVIDARVRHVDQAQLMGADFRLSTLTQISVAAERVVQSYGDDIVGGQLLSQRLDRHSSGTTVTVTHDLTPLTSLNVTATANRSAFGAAADRDTRLLRVTSGLGFRPLALISGRFDLGVLRVRSPQGLAEPFTGLSIGADLRYALLGTTEFGLGLSRNLDYSLDEASSYYIQTGVTGSVTRRFGGRWDARFTLARQHLDYRARQGDRSPTAPPLPDGSVYQQYSAGLACQVTRSVRFAVDTVYMQRISDPGAIARDYRGTNIVSSVSYALR